MTTPAIPTRRRFLKHAAALGAASLLAAGEPRAEAAAAGEQPVKDRWQIGIYTRPWAKVDWRVALDAIAEAGYRYAGLMSTNSKTRLVISAETTPEEAQRVGEECRKRNLRVPSVYGGNIPVAESLEAGIAGMKRLIDNCAACGAANLLMGGIGNEKLYDLYYKAIAETCAYAVEKGVGISVKPHGGLNATGPQCRKTIEKVSHANFRIWYDPGNIFFYSDGQLNPVDDARTVAGLVAGMCVKDYKSPKRVDLTPGDGQVDFKGVMQVLKAGGFTSGALVIECLAPGDEKHLLAEARRARQFLEQLVGQTP